VLVVAALATGAVVAWIEAREAQQQQAQAEGLIEFMLGDLPARLKPVGRLDALDAVGERALAYYAAQDPARLDAASLGRRARALHLLGEIEEQRGRLDDAARRFDAAEAATAALLARHSDDPQHLFNHGQSAYWVGFVARRRGQAAQAEAAFGRYLALAETLVQRDPGRIDWRVELAYAGQNLGVLQLESGQAAPALRSFERTRQVWQETVPQRPALAIEHANTLGWIAEAHEALNDFDAALGAQRAKLAVLQGLPDAGRDREAQHLVANGHSLIARLNLALGRLDAAVDEARHADRLSAALVDLDPENQLWLSLRAVNQIGLAESLLARPDRSAAQAVLHDLEPLVRRLLSVVEPKHRTVINLQGQWLALRAALDPAVPADLQQAMRDYLALVRRHEAQGRPLDAAQSRIVASVGLALGRALSASGDGAGARAVWADALRHVQPGVRRGEAPALALQGWLALLGDDAAGSTRAADLLAASAYRHPDAIALLRALGRPAPIP
jgi:serine/threonine-protein kinase